jgi:molybdenum-dependent DNA-binding transcriptional regulator ModE
MTDTEIFWQAMSRKILLLLSGQKQRYISEVAEETGGTYKHVFNLLKKMEDQRILLSTREGNKRYVRLTKKGELLAGAVREFEDILAEKPGKILEKSSPNLEKLAEYRDSLSAMLRDLKSRKITPKEAKKYNRLLGRYRSLTKRIKIRSREGFELKREVGSLLLEAGRVISRHATRCLRCGAFLGFYESEEELRKDFSEAIGAHDPWCNWNYCKRCPKCGYQNNLAKFTDRTCTCDKTRLKLRL